MTREGLKNSLLHILSILVTRIIICKLTTMLLFTVNDSHTNLSLLLRVPWQGIEKDGNLRPNGARICEDDKVSQKLVLVLILNSVPPYTSHV